MRIPHAIMRFLFAAHNVYTDHTSGAALSMRVLMEWLAAAGHDCEALATARFGTVQPVDIDEHLAQLEVPLTRAPASTRFTRSVQKPRNVVVGRPTVRFSLRGVEVTTLLTLHNDVHHPDPVELEQFLFLFDEAVRRFSPDVLLTHGQVPTPQELMRRARKRSVITVFCLHAYGYYDRSLYRHADHVLTTSAYLSEYYRTKIGLISTAIPSPMEWADILAPTEDRAYVTMVNPALHKGGALFARLAERLGIERPDIPVLAVLSTSLSHVLGEFGIDFDRFQHFLGTPPVPRAADFFALTKILLVPSVFGEPFGRVAAEALINGIPPLVGNRGALPETVDGGGRVLPIPEWMTETGKELPSAEEVAPWFDAICELWDDPARYAEASALARQAGERLYGEDVLRQRYLDYFASLGPGGPLFE
jgi:glycosyltransferase involved in cell wall biosynthesis